MVPVRFCRVFSNWKIYTFFTLALLAVIFLTLFPDYLLARNINEYKDVISNSAPNSTANHTLSFKLNTTVAPGAYIEIIPPDGFEVLSTSTFEAVRNVQLSVNGAVRSVGTTQTATEDFVEIVSGTPGLIRYTLNTSSGITSGSQLQIKIGNHTNNANTYSEVYDEDTMSTTTTQADIKPIINAATIGTHKVDVRVYDGVEVADAGFLIALVDQVGVGPIDTTEEIPPFRFNAQPVGDLGGTTLNVEISLETDELAICKFSQTAGESYASMATTFSYTGLLLHSQVVAVTPGSVQTFYVRCIDDEGNFNTDDFLITFGINEVPTGTSNTDGSVDGDGTGSGNDGTGSGGGSGGTEGSSDGVAPTTGNTSGGGGSGGGGGGGSGGSSGSEGGGGFESTDGPYRSGDGQVTITGYASPKGKITALVDGKIAASATANASGEYSVVIDKIAKGVYTFGVYATDAVSVKSSTFSTSFTVSGGRASALSNINIPSSILVAPDPVLPGQSLVVSGYTLPNATVTVENEKDKNTASRKIVTASSNANGAWSVTLDTAGFTNGTYKVRAKAAQVGALSTNFSNYVLYGVGQAATRTLNADLNSDGKVNLTDFSIMLFWWNGTGGDSEPPADINADGKVNLTDFSIMLFNWTG